MEYPMMSVPFAKREGHTLEVTLPDRQTVNVYYLEPSLDKAILRFTGLLCLA